HLHYTVREPWGVVARIIPYNHPIMFAASRVAPALVAGNAIVVKAPDQTPLSGLRMAELFAEVLPPGLVTVLTGLGSVAVDARVRALAEEVRVGDPLDPATEMGTMVSKAQHGKVLSYIEAGRSAGAKLVTGGGRPPELDRGYYVSPTLFTGVDPSMKIAR